MLQYLQQRPQDVHNLEAFLVTIAKRRAIDHTRSRTRARARDERLAGELALSAPDVAEDIAARAEAFWADEQARRLLRPHVYELLRLVADGVPFPEVARALDMSERAVQSHLLRARRVVRAALAKTLAALGLGSASLRKWSGTAAASAPVVAAALVIGGGVLGGPAARSAEPALVLLPSTTWAVDAEADRARLTSTGRRTTSPAASDAAGGAHRGDPTTVAGLQTPVIGVKVQKREDGQQSSGPVERLQQCVENLRIELDYLGCEQESAQQDVRQASWDGPALPAVG
ncbi:MAG: sigma-70 family RNA polymerase sigma factor [Actinomycetota bacterium]|nr:sigma-70 family RNA polymerase sigma factor [Actinomycetota bacterium]